MNKASTKNGIWFLTTWGEMSPNYKGYLAEFCAFRWSIFR